MKTEAEYLTEELDTLTAENKRLRAALKTLVDQISDFELESGMMLSESVRVKGMKEARAVLTGKEKE